MKRLLLVAGILLGVGVGSASCSSTDRVDLAKTPESEGGPVFTDPSVNDASLGDVSESLLQCIGTECPEPFATCNSLLEPTYKCGTDLTRDNNNCGSCGNECVKYEPINMTSRCVEGACELQCYKHFSGISKSFEDWTDCNGLVEDGCEADLTNDPNNCGVCGNGCGDGVPCKGGKCGCSGGLILCDGKCVDPNWDDGNCGTCGNVCQLPGDACDPFQPNSLYGCVLGVCGRKKCKAEMQFTWVDCNNDLIQNRCDGDGCEVPGLTTLANCGTCGNKCKGNEQCIDEGNGYECAVPCERAGKVLCGDTCVDLLSDRQNCGTCGTSCKNGAEDDDELKRTTSCKQGLCVYECQPGFADCNADPRDGCETDLRIHPQNCGACGVSCNVLAGQPCIEGKCLMTGCDAGVTN